MRKLYRQTLPDVDSQSRLAAAAGANKRHQTRWLILCRAGMEQGLKLADHVFAGDKGVELGRKVVGGLGSRGITRR